MEDMINVHIGYKNTFAQVGYHSEYNNISLDGSMKPNVG